MILGIGVDVVRIDRLRHAAERLGDRFLRRVYTEGELACCLRSRDPYPSLAARFAAKEAAVKALAPRGRLLITDVEVIGGKDGPPAISASGRLGALLKGLKDVRIHLSLSHEREYAVAMVVVEARTDMDEGDPPG